MSALDYPILGKPTVSLAAFIHALQAAGSPAASQGAGIYNAFVAQGVDPSFALAIAQHESNLGKAGIAIGRNNLFGQRYYASQSAYGAVNAGGWAKFPNYVADAKAEAALLAGGLYGKSTKYSTALTFPFRYAPSSDGNSPANYGKAIVAYITKLSGGKGAIAAHPSTTAGTAAHAAANPTTQHGATPAPRSALRAAVAAHPKSSATIGGAAAAALLLLFL